MGQDGDGVNLSAFDFDILREAFRKSVVEMSIAEDYWPEHAKRLLREVSDGEPDEGMVSRIIGR